MAKAKHTIRLHEMWVLSRLYDNQGMTANALLRGIGGVSLRRLERNLELIEYTENDTWVLTQKGFDFVEKNRKESKP